jgi:hypothetical protein
MLWTLGRAFATGGTDDASDWPALPVTLRIQTGRICSTVKAFDPSGAQVNSAESESAVRYKHDGLKAHIHN